MVGEPLAANLDQLFQCRTMDERWTCFTDIYRSFGFDQINYAVLNVATEERSTASVTQYSTMDPGWIDFYLGERLDLDDPHVRFVREFGFKPYFFEAAMARDLPDNERKVMEQAAEAGLRSQISVIFPTTTGESAPSGGISIGSSLSAAEYRALAKGKEQQLIALSMIFHSLSIGDVRRSQLGVRPLSERERDCSRYVADGLRVGRIADRMAISEVTVELHLRNARRKLGATTTPHAVSLALFAGELAI